MAVNSVKEPVNNRPEDRRGGDLGKQDVKREGFAKREALRWTSGVQVKLESFMLRKEKASRPFGAGVCVTEAGSVSIWKGTGGTLRSRRPASPTTNKGKHLKSRAWWAACHLNTCVGG